MTEAKPPTTTNPPVPQIGQLTARRGADLLIPPDMLEQLSRQAGIHAPGHDYQSAAQQLNAAVFCTLMDSNTSSPNHVWRAWYQALHKQAEALLKLLEFPAGNETIRLPSLERNRASLYALRSVACTDAVAGALPSPADQALRVIQGADIIRLIPWVIAYLSEISRMGAAQHAAPRRGRRKETFKPLLLSRLARVYTDLTGTPAPSIRDTAGDYQPNTPPILWLRSVLTMAALQLPDCFDAPNLDAASNAITDLLRLQDATLSTLFRDDNL